MASFRRIVILSLWLSPFSATHSALLEKHKSEREFPDDRPTSKETMNLLQANYYVADDWTQLPDNGLVSSSFIPYKSEMIDTINYPKTIGHFAGSEKSVSVAALFTGNLEFKSKGVAWFCIISADGSKLFVDDELIINNDGVHVDRIKCQSYEIKEESSVHKITVEYFKSSTQGSSLMLKWRQPRNRLFSIILPTSWIASVPTTQPSMTTSSSSIIRNNQIWKDTDGNTVWASLGGHITRFDDIYYWVGTDPRQTDSSNRIYSSRTLGSSSWAFENYVDRREGTTENGKKITGKRNCTLLFCSETEKYVIFCKGVTIYESTVKNSVVGSYEFSKKLDVKALLGNRGAGGMHQNYKAGGMSAYSEDGKAYLIISIKHQKSLNRYCLVVEMSSDYLSIMREVLWLPVAKRREAFWLFRKDEKYYMSYDGPGGWMGSDCYYRTANSLEGPWSDELEIRMDPEPTEDKMRSHASQHRYIMNIDGQWIYGGDRYPFHAPDLHPVSNGLHIMCPVRWEDGHPTVVWEDEWNIRNYTG